jgi:hypothetical protein
MRPETVCTRVRGRRIQYRKRWFLLAEVRRVRSSTLTDFGGSRQTVNSLFYNTVTAKFRGPRDRLEINGTLLESPCR